MSPEMLLYIVDVIGNIGVIFSIIFTVSFVVLSVLCIFALMEYSYDFYDKNNIAIINYLTKSKAFYLISAIIILGVILIPSEKSMYEMLSVQPNSINTSAEDIEAMTEELTTLININLDAMSQPDDNAPIIQKHINYKVKK